jgi:hypothetical protein
MIRCFCPHCDLVFEVAEQHAGKTFRCPACGKPIKVPPLCQVPIVHEQQPAASEVEQSESNRARNRWLLWSGLALGVLVLIWLAAPRRLERSHNRIRVEMTGKEVMTILGEPVDSLATLDSLNPTVRSWAGDDGEVIVLFDGADRVSVSHFYRKVKPSRLQQLHNRLRSWLGW